MYSANSQTAMRTMCDAMAHAWIGDQEREARWLKDGLSWSARKRMEVVRRKTWPDRSWPFLNLGRTARVFLISGEAKMTASKNSGCESGVSVDFEKQSSWGTVRASPEAERYATHSPPERTVKRSRMGGPKNQLMKRLQRAVRARYLRILSLVLAGGGLVRNVKAKTADVQPQAYLRKYWLNGLDLEAK